METIKFKTTITGKQLSIPEDILEKMDDQSEVEVVFRPLRHGKAADAHKEDVLLRIQEQMDMQFPNLNSSGSDPENKNTRGRYANGFDNVRPA